METSPSKILENFHNKQMNREGALEKILYIIENSENVEYRVKSIEILKYLNPKGELVFPLLENLILSDSNESIRMHATEAIRELYIERAFPLMQWAYQHEKSLACLISIIKTIGKMENKSSRLFLHKILEDIKNPRFRKDIALISNDIDEINTNKLAKIIINYLVIDFLENKFDRIEYVTKGGLITELDLSYIGSTVFNFNILNKLPEFISILNKLEKLDLKINKLLKIPASLSSLSSLTYLDLSYNKLKVLPNSIGLINTLETLYLRYNHIEKLPYSIGNLKSLKILDLRSNNLHHLPDSIVNLKNLKVLDLHGNRLEKLPTNFGNLKSIINLELGLNDLQELPQSMEELIHLRKLVLGGNQELCKVPDCIKNFYDLKELHLYDNKLEKLSPGISKLSSIEILNLRNNSLCSVPKEILFLKKLKSLNLSWNKIVHVPDWMTELKDLEELILWGNKLEEFPEIILELPSLKLIDLNFNKIISIDPNIITNLEKRSVKLLR